ncbi:ABC transporter ATP-binding protein, partial [Ameyamaea chiangmaiensis]
MTAVLRLEALRVTVHVPPVSLGVEPGGLLCLLGTRPEPLSDLLDVIAGHRPAALGRVCVEERALGGLGPPARPVGLVSPRDPLFGHLSVRDNVAFSLRARRRSPAETAARVGQVMAMLGLDGLADRPVAALDAAYRVRLMLARAVAFGPAVLLLDDPLAGLEPGAVAALTRVIARLPSMLGGAVVLSTTRREEALAFGAPIALFDGPSLLQTGTAADLLDNPGDDGVAVLFGEANALRGVVTDIADDLAQVHLSCGADVEARAMPGLEPGVLCRVCIRPDRIAPLFPSRPGAMGEDEGTLAAHLADAAHLGTRLRLRFRLADGTEVTAHRPPIAALPGM